MSSTKLAVIIPAYNEEDRIGRTLDRCVEYLKTQNYTWSITVVSDGATDKTNSIVTAMSESEPRVQLYSYSPNRGKGYAVKKGMLAAQAEWVLFSDADLAAPIEEVEKLIPYLDQGTPIAIGSRPLKESHLEIRQPWYREFLGRAFNGAVQLLAVRGISDTQCGFKLFTQDAAQQVFSRCKLDGFSFDFEALLIARDLGLVVAEVPIRWAHQEGSKVNLVRDGTRMIIDLIKLRFKGKSHRIKVIAD